MYVYMYVCMYVCNRQRLHTQSVCTYFWISIWIWFVRCVKQKVGQAYQILSDDNLRSSYDRGGKGEVEERAQMDSAALFAMIFGSEKFIPLGRKLIVCTGYILKAQNKILNWCWLFVWHLYVVGELKIASQMQMKENEKQNNKLDAFRQRKREIQCALNLVEKLQPYIDSGANDQVKSCVCVYKVK